MIIFIENIAEYTSNTALPDKYTFKGIWALDLLNTNHLQHVFFQLFQILYIISLIISQFDYDTPICNPACERGDVDGEESEGCEGLLPLNILDHHQQPDFKYFVLYMHTLYKHHFYFIALEVNSTICTYVCLYNCRMFSLHQELTMDYIPSTENPFRWYPNNIKSLWIISFSSRTHTDNIPKAKNHYDIYTTQNTCKWYTCIIWILQNLR